MNDSNGWTLDQLRALLREELRAERVQPSPKFSEVWAKYDKHIEREKWAKNVRSLMQHAVAYFGPMDVASLTVETWEAYVASQLQRTTNREKPPATSSLNTQLARLKTFLRWAAARKHIGPSALLLAKPLKQRPGRETEIHLDGEARLLAAAGPLLRAIYLVAVDSMARATEVRTLTWQQLDLDRGRVTLYWWRAKTKRARVTRISSAAVEAVKALPRHVSSPYVFANPITGKPWSASRIWELWREGCAEARLEPDDPEDENVHLHDARGTGMSRLARLKVPIPTILKMSGHRSLQRAQRYLHADEGDLDEAKRVMDGARRGPKRTERETCEDHEARSNSDQSSRPSNTTK